MHTGMCLGNLPAIFRSFVITMYTDQALDTASDIPREGVPREVSAALNVTTTIDTDYQ